MKRALAAVALAMSGCASIHTYDAARDINPARTLAVSGSVGTTFDDRDRTGDKQRDGWRRERVLVPDAKLLIQIPLNEVLSIALDPLPPAIGGGLVAKYRPEIEWAPTVTISPTIGRLVFPPQDIFIVDVPLAFSYRAGVHWILYAGPKYVYQSRTLHPVKGTQKLIFDGIPKRPDQPLEMQGVFAGFGFGFTHVQISPEVIWYESRRGDRERIVQIGSQIRFSL